MVVLSVFCESRKGIPPSFSIMCFTPDRHYKVNCVSSACICCGMKVRSDTLVFRLFSHAVDKSVNVHPYIKAYTGICESDLPRQPALPWKTRVEQMSPEVAIKVQSVYAMLTKSLGTFYYDLQTS